MAPNTGQIHPLPTRAELIADNLLDFSHLAFVHNRTIGTRAQANVRAEVEALENALNIRYVTLARPTAPYARAVGRLPEITYRFRYYNLNVKGFFFAQDSVIARPGEGRETSDPAANNRHRCSYNRILQLLNRPTTFRYQNGGSSKSFSMWLYRSALARQATPIRSCRSPISQAPSCTRAC